MTDIKRQYTDKLKQVELAKAGMNVDSTKDYVKYIDGETKEDIAAQARQVAGDAKGKKKSYTDTNVDQRGKVWRPFD